MTTQAEFTIGEVAAMIGFSPHTIRAWERRHQILKPHRTPSNQRRYSVEDIELLREVINGVVVRGLSLKVAVRAAHGAIAVPSADDAPATAARAEAAPVLGPEADADVPWRAVADFLPELIAVLDEEGCVVDANVALASAAGRLREHLRGVRFVDFADPYDRAKAVTAFRQPFLRRKGWELNLRLPGGCGLYTFDCLPIRFGDRQLLIVMGRAVSAGSGDD
ncbi:MAG TPA: MerR family transcriptional regulator [Terriglobales bacterium]|nr:MerR family transcriptional regulator [Terriglobales bacterium]